MDHAQANSQAEFIAYMAAALEKRGFVRDPLYTKPSLIAANIVLKFLRHDKDIYLRVYTDGNLGCALDENHRDGVVHTISAETPRAWRRDKRLLTILETL